MAVLNGGVQHTGEVQVQVELKADGTVGGSMQSQRLDLMSGKVSGSLRRLELFGTHTGGKATLGTVDERGRRVAGWIEATYDGTILRMQGTTSATELGLTVQESVEARLKPR